MSAPLDWAMSRTDSAISAEYYRVTRCGRYSIAQISLGGDLRYTAWLRSKQAHKAPTQLGMYVKPESAKNCCQRHADKRAANPPEKPAA